ncbi:MAG: transposase [Reinekea sp.]
MVRLIDSTTIDMNLHQFQWARFRSTKAGIKLHTVYDPQAEVPVFFEMTEAKMNDRKALSSLFMMAGMTSPFKVVCQHVTGNTGNFSYI